MNYFDKRKEADGMAATTFGKKITALRKKKGLTQAKLAEQINVSNKAISRWETGEGYPEVSLLRPLAKALGTTVDDLLNEEEDETREQQETKEEENIDSEKEEKKIHNNSERDNKEAEESHVETDDKKSEEVPIELCSVKDILKGIFLSDKIYIFFYILIMASMLIPFSDGYGGSARLYDEKDLMLSTVGFLALSLHIGIGAILIFVQIKKWKRGQISRNTMLGNVIFLILFIIGYIISFKPVFDIYPEDYFRVNRNIMMWCTIIVVCGLVIINLKDLWKNKRDNGIYRFWNSLVRLNKIAVASLILCFAIILAGYMYKIFRPNGMFTTIFYMYPVAIASVGMASSGIGFLLSIFGLSKRQTKGYIALAIICYVARYVFPFIAMPAMFFGGM